MTVVWMLQAVVDIAFIAFLVVWWRERGLPQTQSPITETPSPVPDLQEKLTFVDQQMDEYRKRMNAQLMQLGEVCKEAKQILDRGLLRVAAFSPSEEERELRERSGAQIPSLQEVEKSRQRLKSDVIVDLKTLLKDQLA